MAPKSEFVRYLEELFAPLGDVTLRAMFGGVGIFRDGRMFALVAYETLYFKADETNIPAFEAEGCGPFVYEGKGKTVQMGYWRAPERLFDDADAFAEWARTAIGVAERAALAKPKKSRSKRNGTAAKTPS